MGIVGGVRSLGVMAANSTMVMSPEPGRAAGREMGFGFRRIDMPETGDRKIGAGLMRLRLHS